MSFAPQVEDAPVLVTRELFEELIEQSEKVTGKKYELEYRTHRGTLTYVDAIVYEVEPHPDPLTVER